NVLHHLRDQKGHAAKLARLCRPRGTIFLCTFAGGRSLAMRAANAWLSLRNAAWRGMVSPAKLEQSLTRVPYVEVRDRDELSAGAWRLQLFCLALREPPARRGLPAARPLGISSAESAHSTGTAILSESGRLLENDAATCVTLPTMCSEST